MSEEILINGKKITELSDMFFEYCELKKENEKLQEEIYATRNNRLKMYESFETECNKYKQALEEIREMLKKSMSLKSNAYNHFINVEKAIDKINEVINDRN